MPITGICILISNHHHISIERTKRNAESTTDPSILIQRTDNHLPTATSETLSPLYTNSSSKTKGKDARILNGHPKMAPEPYAIVAKRVLSSSLFVDGFSAKANPNILQYIANEEGKNAFFVC